MTTADEVNNKILSVNSDFDDIASCGYSSVLRFISHVDAKLRGHWRLRFERNSVPSQSTSVWLQIQDHRELTAGWTHRRL